MKLISLLMLMGSVTALAPFQQHDVDWAAPLNKTTSYLPRWSPDQGRLVFYRRLDEGWRLFQIDADGKQLRPLSDGRGNDYQPAWSPDGEWIAFDSDRDGNRNIYLKRVDDTSATRLTDSPARDVMPSWSPDGRSVVFVSDREDGAQIWILNRADQLARRVTSGRWTTLLRPLFSPDGEWLTFAGGTEADKRAVFVIRRDGTQLRQITAATDVGNPSWSPDGSRVIYEATPSGGDKSDEGEFELFTVDVRGGAPVRLTNDRVNDWAASYSRDGRFIAFCRGMNDQYEIFVMRADGTALRRVTQLVYR